jgi:hypothetical protein
VDITRRKIDGWKSTKANNETPAEAASEKDEWKSETGTGLAWSVEENNEEK